LRKNIHKRAGRFFRIFAALLICLNIFSLTEVSAAPRLVSVIIDTSRGRVNISPYIYGINDNSGGPDIAVKAVKQHGAFIDTYNWELDAANTGANNGNANIFMSAEGGADTDYSVTALYPSAFMDNAASLGIPGRFLSIPMSGYAAADTDGTVYSYDSGRFVPLLDRKNQGSEYLLTPEKSDGFVYNDEYIAYMINRFGDKAADITAPDGTHIGGVTGYFLGSEPEALSGEFPALELRKLTAQALAADISEGARMVRQIDPKADIFAPGIRGLESFINLSNSTDWEPHSDQYSWFIDFFLDRMREASRLSGERLLDVLDLQYFTEAETDTGASVIGSESASANAARIDAPRLFWDSSYTESSRTAVTYKAYTPLLPTLQASIRMFYPGTKLGFSEYGFGGGGNSSGGIAVADTLGIFSENGVYFAGLSKSQDAYDFESAGLEIYTDYDGAGSAYGPVAVTAENSGNSAVYASTGAVNDSTLTVCYINKTDAPETAHFLLFANSDYDTVRIFGFDSESPEITDRYDEDAVVSSNIFEYEVPPLSVYMFEFTGIPHPGAVTTAPISEEQNTTTTPAVTDPYGVTITAEETTETSAATIAPASTEPVTTISAPVSPEEPGSEIPLIIRIIGIVLIFGVIGVFAYVIFTIFRS
jgi:hypothetical protein